MRVTLECDTIRQWATVLPALGSLAKLNPMAIWPAGFTHVE